MEVPTLGDMEGFLKVAIPDELRDSIIWKTLPVRPNMNTKDVCKFMITKNLQYWSLLWYLMLVVTTDEGFSIWFRVNTSYLIVCVLTVRLFVCTGSLIAHKFRITNPQDYGLYLLVNGEGWSANISYISFNVQVLMIFG